MRAVAGIDAGVRQPKALHRPAVDQVLLDDLLGVAGMGETVPDRLRINHQDRGMLALIKAPSLIDADPMLQARSFDGVLERAAQLLAVFIGATGAAGGFIAFILANK